MKISDKIIRYAYLYLRFSNKEQADGDSVRRQKETAQQYCDDSGFTLIIDDDYHDKGVSSYHGANAKKGLGKFLEAVKSGKISKGSALVVESIDRLSRQDPMKTFKLLSGLLDAQIEIHFTSTRSVLKPGKVDPGALFMAMGGAIRGNEESSLKESRILERKAEDRKKAEKGEGIVSKSCPWWLVYNEETKKIEERPGGVVVLKKIFEMCRDGHSTATIARKLNSDEEAAKLRPNGWLAVRVRDTIRSDAPLGVLSATRKTRIAGRDYRIPNHYPVLIDHALAAEARAMMARRNTGQHGCHSDHTGTRPAHLFSGILRAHNLPVRWSARPNGVRDEHGKKGLRYYYEALTPEESIKQRLLECFNSDLLEKTILAALVELQPADVLNEPEAKILSRSSVIQAELAKLDATIENLVDGVKAGSRRLVLELTRVESARDAKAKELGRAQAEERLITRELPKRELSSLLQSLHDLDLRDRASAAIRRIVQRIDVATDYDDLPLAEDADFILNLADKVHRDGATCIEDPFPRSLRHKPRGARRKPLAALVTFLGGARRLIVRFPDADHLVSVRVESVSTATNAA